MCTLTSARSPKKNVLGFSASEFSVSRIRCESFGIFVRHEDAARFRNGRFSAHWARNELRGEQSKRVMCVKVRDV